MTRPLIFFIFLLLNLNGYSQTSKAVFDYVTSFNVTSRDFLPTAPNSIAEIADFDGDGKQDISVVNDVGNTGYLTVYKNKAVSGVLDSSSFTKASFPGFQFMDYLTSGDIDGDGKIDILTCMYTGIYKSNAFYVYKNNSTVGNISFNNPVMYPVPNAATLKLSDMDGDGKPDLVIAQYLLNMRVYKNISTVGTIAFDTVNYLSYSGGAYDITLEDMDGDGLKDIVSSNGSIRRNTSSGGVMSFAAGLSFINSATMMDYAMVGCGDIDGDGKKDMILAGIGNSGSIWFIRNTSVSGTLTFDAPIKLYNARGHGSVRFADFNNDGREELLLGHEGGPGNTVFRTRIYSYYGVPGSIDTNYMHVRLLAAAGDLGASAGDLDGDGYMDIVAANTGVLRLCRNRYSTYTGLVAYYPFDGNTADSSGCANDGSVTGATLTTDRFGNPNKAYSFTANTNKISADLFYSDRPFKTFSISVWIRSLPKVTTERNTIISLRTGNLSTSPETFAIYTHPNAPHNNKWAFGITAFPSPGTKHELINKKVKADYAWMHIAATYDGDTMKIYTNGTLDTSYVVSMPKLLYGTQQLIIGNAQYTGTVTDGFRGSIDDVRIYDRELSHAEISVFAGETAAPEYYSKSSGDLNLLSTWGTAPDGSGTSPLSFDSANVAYYVVNNSNPTLSGSLIINGTGSRLVFGDGVNSFNLTVPNGSSVSCDSIYVNHNIILTVMGTLSSTRLGSGAPSTVQYFQSTPQTIAAGSYDNLVAGLSDKTLTGFTTVRSTLSMMSSIDCNGYELTLGTSTALRGTLNRSGGAIKGKFTRWFANTTNSGITGLFPVGTLTKYTPLQIEFTSAPASGGTITAEFIPSNPGNAGLPLLDFTNGTIFIDKVAVDGYWKISSTGVTGGTFANIVTANNFTSVNDYTGLRMIRRNTSAAWTLQGTAGSNTGSNTSAVVSRTSLTTLAGEYGVGGDQSVNPLPVKLVAFTGKIIDPTTSLLSWQTSSEINAAKFIIQRSVDKSRWTNAGELKAMGNSNILSSYHFRDHIAGITNVLYYRLVQVDIDGRQNIERTIKLDLTTSDQANLRLSVYPNPANDRIFISGMFSNACVYDITGKMVKEVPEIGWLDIRELPSGLYFVRSGQEAVKFVKQ